jgi:hypothetical protein
LQTRFRWQLASTESSGAKQGYTAAILVKESRFVQMCVFGSLQRNLSSLDFSKVISDIVTIADECDSQLKQAMLSYPTPTITSKGPKGLKRA